MWYREQPLDQGHPSIEISFHVRVVDLQVDRLLLDGGRVLVSEQSHVGTDSGPEAG